MNVIVAGGRVLEEASELAFIDELLLTIAMKQARISILSVQTENN